MPDPIMVAVATALAVRTTEAVVVGAPVAWRSLVGLVRRRFAGDAVALRTWEDARATPDDHEAVGALADSLDRLAGQDDDFDAGLRQLWAQAGGADVGSVINYNSGAITGSLLQGRDFTLSGQLNFGGAAPPR